MIFEILPTQESPHFRIDHDKGHIFFKGILLSSKGSELCQQMVAAIGEYAKNPQSLTIMDCYIVYCNETNCGHIYKIFKAIREFFFRNNNDFICRWHYDQDDRDILELGKEYESIGNIKFEFIEDIDEPSPPRAGNMDIIINNKLDSSI
jgi:hypothetical protein